MSAKYRRKADEGLLLSLACGATVDSAARSAGLTPRTVYRRLQDPEFRQRLQAVRADMVQRTAGTLTAAALEAVKTLLALLQSSVAAPVRLGAARSILELGIKLREVADLEARLQTVEEQLTEASPGITVASDQASPEKGHR